MMIIDAIKQSIDILIFFFLFLFLFFFVLCVCQQWEDEGVAGFREKFGAKAFGLHHRFFWHLDSKRRLWLSAEDGCEGFASNK